MILINLIFLLIFIIFDIKKMIIKLIDMFNIILFLIAIFGIKIEI